MTTMVQVIFKIKCGGGKNLPISIITLLMKYLYKYYIEECSRFPPTIGPCQVTGWGGPSG